MNQINNPQNFGKMGSQQISNVNGLGNIGQVDISHMREQQRLTEQDRLSRAGLIGGQFSVPRQIEMEPLNLENFIRVEKPSNVSPNDYYLRYSVKKRAEGHRSRVYFYMNKKTADHFGEDNKVLLMLDGKNKKHAVLVGCNEGKMITRTGNNGEYYSVSMIVPTTEFEHTTAPVRVKTVVRPFNIIEFYFR